MNFEAVMVVGAFIVAIGLILSVPTWLWMRRARGRGLAPADRRLTLTKSGWMLIIATVLVLIGGFSLQYVAPDSILGELVQTPAGRLLYALAVVCAFFVVELALGMVGVKLLKPSDTAR